MNTKRRNTEKGNALILALLMTFFMVALSSAQFAVVQKNTQQARFMTTHDDLRGYSDSAVHLAVHDLNYTISGNSGNIGMGTWTVANDYGKDGVPSTVDLGEGVGLPTPGEPNLVPVSVGSTGSGVQMICYAQDSAWTNVKRLVATTFTADAQSTVEVFAQTGNITVPDVGAIYIDPGVALDLKSNAFLIDGKDTNPDGTPGTGGDKYGIATEEGATAGENQSDINDQIDSSREDQVQGVTVAPSVGEVTGGVDIEALFKFFHAQTTNSIASGQHSNVTWGDPSSPTITYCDGDLRTSGQGTGAGVLLVDGNLQMSGQFDWEGLVIVRGDVQQTGGGNGTHVWGTLMVTESISLIDTSELEFTGTAEVYYSSQTLANINANFGNGPYTILYWDYLK